MIEVSELVDILVGAIVGTAVLGMAVIVAWGLVDYFVAGRHTDEEK